MYDYKNLVFSHRNLISSYKSGTVKEIWHPFINLYYFCLQIFIKNAEF